MTTSVVFVLPPSESCSRVECFYTFAHLHRSGTCLCWPLVSTCRIRVSLESRNGMCAPFSFSLSALMQFPRADSDLLMAFASSSVCPRACVFPT